MNNFSFSSNGLQFDLIVKQDNTTRLVKGLDGAFIRGLMKIGMQAERYAKQLCPVDTGRLRNSITHFLSGKAAYVGAAAHYAKYVECGTGARATTGGNPLIGGMAARPFLRPAATDHSEEYGALLKTEVSKI